jgi:ribosome-binding factor A
MSQRTDRVDELLRQEIGVLLAKEIADPRIGFVTITDVETAPDLRHAKVWVSIIGGKADQKETLRALQHSMGFIRHELGRTLRIKRIPALHVHLDDTAERGTRVLHLLQELEEGKEPETIVPYQESLPKPVQRLPHEGDDPETEGFGGAAADHAAATGGGSKPARRPTTRRGPGGPRAGRGAPPKTPRRAPKRS